MMKRKLFTWFLCGLLQWGLASAADFNYTGWIENWSTINKETGFLVGNTIFLKPLIITNNYEISLGSNYVMTPIYNTIGILNFNLGTSELHLNYQDSILQTTNLKLAVSFGRPRIYYSPYTVRLDDSSLKNRKLRGLSLTLPLQAGSLEAFKNWEQIETIVNTNVPVAILGLKLSNTLWGIPYTYIINARKETPELTEALKQGSVPYFSDDLVQTLELNLDLTENLNTEIVLGDHRIGNISQGNIMNVETFYNVSPNIGLNMNVWNFDAGFDPPYRDKYPNNPEKPFWDGNILDLRSGQIGSSMALNSKMANYEITKFGFSKYTYKEQGLSGNDFFGGLKANLSDYEISLRSLISTERMVNEFDFYSYVNAGATSFAIERLIRKRSIDLGLKYQMDLVSNDEGYFSINSAELKNIIKRGYVRGAEFGFAFNWIKKDNKANDKSLTFKVNYQTPGGLFIMARYRWGNEEKKYQDYYDLFTGLEGHQTKLEQIMDSKQANVIYLGRRVTF